MIFILVLIISLLVIINICIQKSYWDLRKDYNEDSKLLRSYNNIFSNLRDLSNTFDKDGTCPGLTLSYLPNDDIYYASIIRYLYPKGEGKRIVCSITDDKENLITNIFNQFQLKKHTDVEKRNEAYENWKNKLQVAEKT